jgi:ubiquitin-conjugating enzyme E2 O
VDAIQRTALILFPDTGTIELASLLELDPHGNSDIDVNVSQAGSETSFGVRRGDFVFIHSPETTNGLETPRVPRIGEIEAWIRENPFQNGQFVGWRKDLQELGSRIASQRSTGTLIEKRIQMSTNAESKLSWCGEVTGVCLPSFYIEKDIYGFFFVTH